MGFLLPKPHSVTTDAKHALVGSPTDIAARLLAEGTRPLIDAARDAGLQPVPSLRTLLRGTMSNRLESLIIAGRRVTSPAAIVRWIAAEQSRCAAGVPTDNREGMRQ